MTRILEEMALHFRVSAYELAKIVSTAPLRYKQYAIPKKHGGIRIVAQPSRELKALQRYILKTRLSAFPIHSAATGYVQNRNIATNARAHVGNDVLLKLDFRDFFPSISVQDWRARARSTKVAEVLDEDLYIYDKLLFWGQGTRLPKCLSIGAPTSPTLSNIILFGVDEALNGYASDLHLVYTRYADDIAVSGNLMSSVLKFESLARRSISRTKTPRLTFNDEKRGIYQKGQKLMVTGLVITPVGEISVGRERKRTISAMLHKVKIGEIDPPRILKLRGLIGFVLATEPEFVNRMRSKYGNALIDTVLRFGD